MKISDLQNPFVRTIAVSSGKGGVGKSTIVANLAIKLAETGSRILLLDGDLGMANLDILFGLKPKKTIFDLLYRNTPLNEILIEVRPGIMLLPGGSGFLELQELKYYQKLFLLEQVEDLKNQFEYLFIDSAPGIDDRVLYLNAVAQERLVVVTPDPASITDAYAFIKVMNQKYKETKFIIICNQVRDEKEAFEIYRRLSDVAMEFLYVSLDYLGCIPSDPVLRQATKSQQLVVQISSQSPSSKAFQQLCTNLSHIDTNMNKQKIQKNCGGLQFFWQQMVRLP